MKYVLRHLNIFIVISSILILLLITYIIFPKIILKGNKKVVVEYGENYKDEGYRVFTIFKNLDKKVTVKEKINYDEIGNYEIVYELPFLFTKIKKVRKIKIIDSKGPIIELTGENEVIVCPNKIYEEQGYRAYDNYDKEIDSIERHDYHDYILYTAIDSNLNETIAKRNIIYKDDVNPVITLNSGDVSIYVNGIYNEPGFSASDNCDGDITNSVEVINNVDTSKIGNYNVIYKVVDSSGNSFEIERKVNVNNRPQNISGAIYLTFDDGPSSSITPGILDILKEEGVKATFFVINHSDSLNYLIKRAYDEGHTIALHSSSHNYYTIYASEDAFFNDLNIISNKVYNITGYRSDIMRFPGGSSNTVSRFNPGIMSRLSNLVHEKGYKYYDWNVGSGDAGGANNSTEVYNNVVNGLRINRSNVVLMHDYENNYKTLNALKDIIRFGKNNGYTFRKITNETAEVHQRIAN